VPPVAPTSAVGSPSIAAETYWWYRARAELLEAALSAFVPAGGAARLLDVGSADGPSVGWLRDRVAHPVALDLDRRGLAPGGVCGSALELPFAPASFDVVAAFDVVEHCEPESRAMGELARVLVPGGRLLLAVPAYQWAWSSHDDHNGHLRRYTKRRLLDAVAAAGLTVDRASYAFAATFPFFAVERLGRRIVERRHPPAPLGAGEVPPLPEVPAPLERTFMGLSRAERKVLSGHDLPFGSSVVLAATKPGSRT
jgi:SAM-dependent methyltransferase